MNIDSILFIASEKNNYCKRGQLAKFISIVNNGNNDKLVEFCMASLVSLKLSRLIKAVGCMTDVRALSYRHCCQRIVIAIGLKSIVIGLNFYLFIGASVQHRSRLKKIL